MMRAVLGKDPTRAPQSQLSLPAGFRFYPTDEELVEHYLCKKAACEPFAVPIIAEVELYRFDPWDLPAKALFGEREWYFFSPRDRKYPNGSRPNRAAGGGYWKATGTDKPISTHGGKKKVGVKKALVFYKGKAPKGVKTNWIMHEYRLADTSASGPSVRRKGTLRLDDWVLCRIYKKSSSAASQEKDALHRGEDMQAEQSESSCLDDVIAGLSELDDQTNPLHGEAEDEHIQMTPFDALEKCSSSLQGCFGQIYPESASAFPSQGDGHRQYIKELQEGASLESSNNQNGPECVPQTITLIRQENAAPSESNASSRQYSPSEHLHGTNDQQKERMAVAQNAFNSLACLPLTQLPNAASILQFSGLAGSPLYPLDLGLHSPCSMAQGASFGSSLCMDPDYYLSFPALDHR